MKIRVIKETYSGLKPGVYDARKPFYTTSSIYHKPGDLFVGKHYVGREYYQAIPRPAFGGMGKRVMTTTNTLTVASMLSQGFDVRVRDTKTGRFVKWDDIVINTNGSRPMTIDYQNDNTLIRYVVSHQTFTKRYSEHDDRQILNIDRMVTFEDTYSFAQYDIVHQRENDYVFDIFA